MKNTGEEKEIALCRYCLKRKVCKYTESFAELEKQVYQLKEEGLHTVSLICNEYVDYRKVTYRRG